MLLHVVSFIIHHSLVSEVSILRASTKMTPWLTFLTTWLKGGLHVENFSNNSVLNGFFCLSFRYLLVRARVKHFSINFLKLWGFLLETFQKSAKAEIFEKYCHTEFNAFYRFDLSFSL